MRKSGKPLPFRDFHRTYTDNWRDFCSASGREQKLIDPGRSHKNTRGIETRFDGIEEHLIDLIENSEILLGAIAWLTNKKLLKAMAHLKRASIVVQKEDFLRPDATAETSSDFTNRLRQQYERLEPLSNNDFLDSYPGIQEGVPGHNPTIDSWLLSANGQYIQNGDAVRCLGYRRGSGAKSTPVMHHKFAVFGMFREDTVILPTCVVTGSYNWSANAEQSRENLITIYDESVCTDYVSEWAQLWSLSEPLDWQHEHPQLPKHYIGT